MIDVLIADDQQLLVDLLKIGLEQYPDLRVVACAENGFLAQELAMLHQPDVILMDILMPECDGIQATRMIKEWNKKVKILILTNGDRDSHLQKAMAAGADGYVLKNISREDLMLAVKSVCANMKVITAHQRWNQQHQLPGESVFTETEKAIILGDETVYLTTREMDLIAMIVEGKDMTAMAEVLELTEGSVRNLTTAVINKLHLKDRTQLAVFALKNQLV